MTLTSLIKKFIHTLRVFAACLFICASTFTGITATAALTQPVDSVLTIPASVTALPARAYLDRDDFHTLVIAEGSRLRSVGEFAFMGCANLRHVVMPARLAVSFGEGTFRECTCLDSLTIPEGVAELPRDFCEWCVNLREVKLPASLRKIGAEAFAYCYSLEAIDFPARLNVIGSNAFSFCRSLRRVYLPDSVTEVSSYVFADCTSLESLRLPANRKMLGELLITGCRALVEIIEPSAVPPSFDCESPLFDPSEALSFSNLILKVPASALDAYRNHPQWGLIEIRQL